MAPQRQRRALGVGLVGALAIGCFTMSAAAPLTVVGGGAASGLAVSGVIGIPIGYVVIGVVLLLFAPGYVAMSRHITNAGAAYAYITAGLGRVPGVAAASVVVLGYNLMQVSFYGGFGVTAANTTRDLLGLDLPWWAFSVVAWAAIACLGVLKVDVSSRVLAALLTAECLVIVVYAGSFLLQPSEQGFRFDAFDPAQMLGPGAGALLVMAFTGYVGLEGSSVFSEEAKDVRTVSRAMYGAIVVIAVLYAAGCWALTVATGPDHVVDMARSEGLELIFTLAGQRLPQPFVVVGMVLLATSLFAGLLAWHNVVARYHFALGREGVFPRGLGVTSARTRAPRNGSLAQSGIALLAIGVIVLGGLDPTTNLFVWGSVTGAFGVLALLTATSVAVVVFFLRHPELRPNLWTGVLAPGLAAVLLLVVFVMTTTSFHVVLGVDVDDPIASVLPLLYLVVGVLGVVWAVWLRWRRSPVWAGIGQGARAVTTWRRAAPEKVPAADR